MDTIRALQLIALKNLLGEQSEEARWRQICRWYSKTFATPLHVVEDLPRLDILQHYIEENYENLQDAELHLEADRLLTPEEDLAKEDVEMDKLAKQLEKENAQKKAAPPKEATEKKIDKLSDAESEILQSLDGMGQILTDIKKTMEEPTSFDLDLFETEK